MSLSNISPIFKKDEIDVQILINSHLNNNESFVFSAGAGAGKTYALTESLRYIIKEYGDKLTHHNQKIMCITYTNVATNEIKERLGNTDIVKTTTIHERLWALIKDYQLELVKIHRDKMQEEIVKLHFDLHDNSSEKETKIYNIYRELPVESKLDFINVMISQKSEYYKNYDKPAKEFKDSLERHIGTYSSLMSNVVNFKKIVSTIYRITNYSECLKQIEAGNPKYKAVRYENKYNDDILYKMIISHETLLDYALKMIKSYILLRRVIIDSYPFILIDEYQDTNRNVVEIMKLLAEYAKSTQRNLVIGYFGDNAQNIYEDGVGGDLLSVHPNLKVVNKQFNRRSHSEIINVINKIRNDDIKQISIYNDCEGGSVKFYTGTDKIKFQFIAEYRKKWNINSENKLHCLVLMNKFVAEFNGFPDIYRCFSDTAYYKINYDRLNNELLSNDLSKLGDVPNLAYRIIQFIDRLNTQKTSLGKLIEKKIYSKMTFLKIKEIVSIFKVLNGATLGEYVKNVFDKYNNSGNHYFEQVIQDLIDLERYSYQDFTNYLLDVLFLNSGSGKFNDFKLKLMELFEEHLYSKSYKAEIDVVKLKLEVDKILLKLREFLENESISYTDTAEFNGFKSKICNVIDTQKSLNLSPEDIELFKTKLNKLFEDEIFSVIDADEVEIAKTKLNELLNIELSQWFLWYEFINNDQKADTVYHTYHGTKGAEYNNVIIIMENDFGRMNKDKFSSFFKQYKNADSLSDIDKKKYINTKNLLYVSCSRSIKNLRVLYLDNVTEFKEGIKNIFGEIYQYN